MTTTLAQFFKDNPNMAFLDVFMPDMFGILRGKRIPAQNYQKVIDGNMMLPMSAVLQTSLGLNSELVTKISELGDPDFPVQVDENTITPCPWAKQPTATVLGGLCTIDGTPHATNIRTHLQNLVNRIKADFGYTPVTALELEFTLLEGDGVQPPKIAKSRTNGLPSNQADTYGVTVLNNHEDLFADLHATFEAMGLPADAYSKEYGRGQFEINLNHHDDLLRACDEAVLLRMAVREVARKHGYLATFMSKPFEDDEGNGMHVNMSLVDEKGNNIFAGDDYPHDQAPISNTLLHAIAGLQQTTDDCMMLFSTTMNGWRRLVPDSYAPINRSWGVNNRAVGFRVPISNAKSIRLEHRIAGADANPYLVCMGILIGIHQGLQTQQQPSTIVTTGDRSVPCDDAPLPFNFVDAMACFETSEMIASYLDSQFLDYYITARKTEHRHFQAQVTEQDYDWYLDTY